MILLCLLMETVCMLYVSLPVFLSVKSLILNLPTVSSGQDDLSCIPFCDLYVGDPGKFCYPYFSVCLFFFLCIVNQIYIILSKWYLILIFDVFPYLFFFR